MKKVLFVCMGNICRSPSAEAVFRDLVKREGLAQSFVIDSAGTHSYHIGHPPDTRSIKAAKNRGLEMKDLRARQVVAEDFDRFDYLIAMDEANLSGMKALVPEVKHNKATTMMSYANTEYSEVPDPYYGPSDGSSRDGFELVLNLLEQACSGLLKKIQADV